MSDLKDYLAKAKAEFEELDRKRDHALIRLQTLQMVAGDDETPSTSPASAYAPVRRPAKVTTQGNAPRAMAGSWKTAIRTLIDKGLSQFSYSDVMQAAKDLAIDAPMPSVRVRVSKFKAQGFLERVKDGVYKPTKEGRDFFKS